MNLKRIRQERGLSQTKLSGLTGIAQSHISAMENHVIKPYPGWKDRIAKALGATKEEIFYEQEAKADEHK